MTLAAILMSDIERDLKDAGDKMKAAGNKLTNSGRDTETEYKKEKIKEKVD